MSALMDIVCFGLGAGMSSAIKAVMWLRRPTISRTVPTEVDIAYPFQPHDCFCCPKCGRGWNAIRGMVYCECAEYHTGHFHPNCVNNPSEQDTDKRIGCKFKWIMKARQ